MKRTALKKSDQDLVDRFLDAMWLESGLSLNTLMAYRSDLEQYTRWLYGEKSGFDLANAGRAQVLSYLSHCITNGSAAGSSARKLSSLRRFYRYFNREGTISDDPTSNVDSPIRGHYLPNVLSEDAVEALLKSPDTRTVLGIRDRAMLETLYATGLRVSELVQLSLAELDESAGLVRVIGKGQRERIVPLGQECLDWLSAYLESARGAILASKSSDAIFITGRGQPISRQRFWQLIKYYGLRSGIGNQLSPHTIRHAFATHLLNHGADLRSLQLLLGHSSLSTTQIYTHVARVRLQSLHATHHPRG